MAAVETQTRLMGGWNRRVWELDLRPLSWRNGQPWPSGSVGYTGPFRAILSHGSSRELEVVYCELSLMGLSLSNSGNQGSCFLLASY